MLTEKLSARSRLLIRYWSTELDHPSDPPFPHYPIPGFFDRPIT